jgi:CarD family transcriptional regulator
MAKKRARRGSSGAAESLGEDRDGEKSSRGRPARERVRGSEATFAVGDFVVYPVIGVGRIVCTESRHVLGVDVELLSIRFATVNAAVLVPWASAARVGLRKLVGRSDVPAVYRMLASRPCRTRAVWAKRESVFRTKVHSGNLLAAAEVARDLYRASWKPCETMAERAMYELARERIVDELTIVLDLSDHEALSRIEAELGRNRGRGASGPAMGRGLSHRVDREAA